MMVVVGTRPPTSKLFVMPGGWLLIDMPGLREIQVWTDDESVCSSFADVQQMAQLCRS
jgi:ribosome biogenesis GTPase